MSNIDEVKSAYDQLATTYDASRYRKTIRQWQDKLERNFVCQHVKPGSRVLEVGCGTGRITNELLGIAESITAVDVSDEMLNVLRSKLGQPEHLTLIRSSLYDIPKQLRQADFDVCICLRTLPHLYEIDKALKILVDSITPGGQAVFDFWNNHSLLGFGRKLLGRKHKIPTFHRTYRQMRQLIDGAGIEVVQELPLWIYPRIGKFSFDGINHSFVRKHAYSVVFDTRKKTEPAILSLK